jgi:hypothetical protein
VDGEEEEEEDEAEGLGGEAMSLRIKKVACWCPKHYSLRTVCAFLGVKYVKRRIGADVPLYLYSLGQADQRY